ncbi:MAG TPA: hypothetical protein VGO67_04075 [Verrucomicrobiae bacterium]|jgi:hypothetical protein
MDDILSHLKTSVAYKLVVAGMAVAAANYIAVRLNLSTQPVEQKDITGCLVAPPGQFDTPVMPTVNLQTSNFMFIFRSGKLYLVMNSKTNIEEVERYHEWAGTPSLINSNEAYQLATQWLSRVYVDVAALNAKYKATVGQPSFWRDPPARFGEQGSNLTTLPLYYVSWSKGDYTAAKVGIFGPTKQMMGLTIEDASLCDRTYLVVTNQRELVYSTNVPLRMGVSNNALLHLFFQSGSPDRGSGLH